MPTRVELDLFSAIAAGRQTVPELARHCEAAEKGIRVLCDYLVVAGFLIAFLPDAPIMPLSRDLITLARNLAGEGSPANQTDKAAKRGLFARR